MKERAYKGQEPTKARPEHRERVNRDNYNTVPDKGGTMKNIEIAINEGREVAVMKCQLDLLASEMIEIAARSQDKYSAIQQAYWAGLAVGLRNSGKGVNYERY